MAAAKLMDKTLALVLLYVIIGVAYSSNCDEVEIVTYGDPCPTIRQLPFQIEFPKPPPVVYDLTIYERDTLRGKSYGYNVEVPPTVTIPPGKNYNFDIKVPCPKPRTQMGVIVQEPVRYLQGLTTKVDRVLVPACEFPSSNGVSKESLIRTLCKPIAAS
ncbi:hypothetical protein KM043_014416 [Ampulex compressa]|nr:hypothetical protein KM043_014416 [Ampulex compressa]